MIGLTALAKCWESAVEAQVSELDDFNKAFSKEMVGLSGRFECLGQ